MVNPHSNRVPQGRLGLEQRTGCMSHPRVKVLVAAVAASSALLLFLPGAGAAPAAGDQYRAEAVASALQLSVFGQSVAIGKASTTADSTPSATATGAGALLATRDAAAAEAQRALDALQTLAQNPYSEALEQLASQLLSRRS